MPYGHKYLCCHVTMATYLNSCKGVVPKSVVHISALLIFCAVFDYLCSSLHAGCTDQSVEVGPQGVRWCGGGGRGLGHFRQDSGCC